MNRKQVNKSRMYGSTDLVLNNHSLIFGTMNELVTAHQKLKDGQLQIVQYRQIQEADNSGMTANKRLLKAALIKIILKFSSALRAYATSIKNEELKVKSHYLLSDLTKAPDSILCDIGALLLGLAETSKTELPKYFIDSDEFIALRNLLDTFKSAIPHKRAATSESKVSTRNIGDVFKSMDKFLREELDELMLPFQFSQPDFYKAYKNARLTVNYSGRGKAKPAETVFAPEKKN